MLRIYMWGASMLLSIGWNKTFLPGIEQKKNLGERHTEFKVI